MLWNPARPKLNATWKHAVTAMLLSASCYAHAQDAKRANVGATSAITGYGVDLGAGETTTSRAEIRKIIERETARTDLPADIAEAVVFVESGYNSAVVGSAGEVGLMQVRPGTAATLGFKGTAAELAEPDLNIHYGVLYLNRAWRLTGGDLCRTLVKYRAGHDEEEMTLRSQVYCNRARNRLLAMNSAAVTPVAAIPSAPAPEPPVTLAAEAKSARTQITLPQSKTTQPKDVYARHRRGTAAASRAYWAVHEARVSRIKARIEARWKRTASR